MRLVRSGEEPSTGAGVGVPVLHALAVRWYGDRLDPGWRPRDLDASQAILASAGLRGPFWDLRATRR